jgi:hypothetical protein
MHLGWSTIYGAGNTEQTGARYQEGGYGHKSEGKGTSVPCRTAYGHKDFQKSDLDLGICRISQSELPFEGRLDVDNILELEDGGRVWV